MKLPYRNPQHSARLAAAGFKDFQDFWALPFDWIEEPNQRREGWSGASMHALPDGSALFVKRQENHDFRSPRHPLGRPTFLREFQNILRLNALGVPTATLLFYGERTQGGKRQAVMVLEALTGHVELDTVFSRREQYDPAYLDALLAEVARVVAILHRHRIQHHCLSGRHLMVRRGGGADGIDLRLLDLEKAKWSPSRRLAACRDVEKLIRHLPTLELGELRRLLELYLAQVEPSRRRPLLANIAERLRRYSKRWSAEQIAQMLPPA